VGPLQLCPAPRRIWPARLCSSNHRKIRSYTSFAQRSASAPTARNPPRCSRTSIHTSCLTSRVPFSFTTTNGKAENRQATRGGRPGNRSGSGRWRLCRRRSSPPGRPGR